MNGVSIKKRRNSHSPPVVNLHWISANPTIEILGISGLWWLKKPRAMGFWPWGYIQFFVHQVVNCPAAWVPFSWWVLDSYISITRQRIWNFCGLWSRVLSFLLRVQLPFQLNSIELCLYRGWERPWGLENILVAMPCCSYTLSFRFHAYDSSRILPLGSMQICLPFCRSSSTHLLDHGKSLIYPSRVHRQSIYKATHFSSHFLTSLHPISLLFLRSTLHKRCLHHLHNLACHFLLRRRHSNQPRYSRSPSWALVPGSFRLVNDFSIVQLC